MPNASPSKLSPLTDELLRILVDLEPVEATGLGLHDSDHLLPDVSLPAWEARVERYRALLARAEALAPEALDPAGRIDREILLGWLRVRLHEILDLRFPQRNPGWYTFLLTHSVFYLLLRDFAPMEERLEAVAARLDQVPRFLAEAALRLDQPPALWVEIALEETEGAMDFFHATFPVLAEQFPKLKRRLLSANLKALRAMVTFSELLQKDVMARSSKTFAAGRDTFEFMLQHRHRIADSPEELSAMGHEELDRARRAMDRMAQEAGETSWEEMVARIQLHHPSSADLLQAYEESLSRARLFVVERGLATLPEEELEIIETPAFLRHVVPFAAYYQPAPFEARQKGHFLVTVPAEDETRELRLRGHNYPGITLTTLHESFPGHHLQLSVSNRAGSPLRRLSDNSMFAEGWALYCEEMMYEAGFYDRKTRLLQLKDLVWRACRVLIDVGLHTGTMGFDDAVEMLVREAKLDRPSAVADVKWYTMAPTYPLSYLRGKREILRLRDRWREQRGPFDAKAFHDALLSAGTLPMALAEQHLFGA
jgi:uncharacterized protein (DUF885 family)